MVATSTRPALGQVASLGTLYNARTDNFVPISLLNAPIPDSAISRSDNHTTTFDYSESDSFEEKFSRMGLNAELKASFLGGLVNVAGSGSYLTESRDTNRIMQASLHYRITTVHESLQFMSNDLKGLFAFKNVDGSFATHVVAGITWGAYTVVTAKHQLSKHDTKTETDINGALKAKLEALQLGVSGTRGYEKDGDQSSDYNFDVHVHVDILADVGALQTTLARCKRRSRARTNSSPRFRSTFPMPTEAKESRSRTPCSLWPSSISYILGRLRPIPLSCNSASTLSRSLFSCSITSVTHNWHSPTTNRVSKSIVTVSRLSTSRK